MRVGQRCIFINGLPGSGKSTVARRLIAGRAGWLNLDVDVLRGMLGVTAQDFAAGGIEVRPLATSLLTTQLSHGGNIVFPQLFFEQHDSRDFEDAARNSGAALVRVTIHESADECWRRVRERALLSDIGSIERQIYDGLESSGGVEEIRRMREGVDTWSRSSSQPVPCTSIEDLVERLSTANDDDSFVLSCSGTTITKEEKPRYDAGEQEIP